MRVLSYNIHKGIGGSDRLYRLERIVRVIEEHKPDIICLQEVDRNHKRSSFHDQPLVLAEHLKCPDHCFQLNVHQALGGYGNLVLSRWNISVKHHISIRQGSRKPRGAQLTVIETPQGKVHLINLHLGLVEKERHWQVKHLLAHSLFAEHKDLPTLIIGDTNDWRNTLQKGVFSPHGFEHHSAPPAQFRSFPAYFPMGSLDKAFGRGVRVERVAVPRGGAARWASDHLPLIVDLAI
jgi:endonuclease/exonuclease/phosphatase family metal-dependent hydrolase